MSRTLIMVSSITYAMKGRDLLNRKGFHAYLERTPRHENVGGCGYSIAIPQRVDEAEEILRKAGIQVFGRIEGKDGL